MTRLLDATLRSNGSTTWSWPPLVPTNVVDGREPEVHFMSPGPDRWKNRSRTYRGIAEAMAEQWSAGSGGRSDHD